MKIRQDVGCYNIFGAVNGNIAYFATSNLLKKKEANCMTFKSTQLFVWMLEQGAVLLIVSGAVEGVVDEGISSGPHNVHPLGKSLGSTWGSHPSQSGTNQVPGNLAGGQWTERVPNICLLGPGSVIEAGLLGIGADNMEFRARSAVELYCLTRQPGSKGSRLWRRYDFYTRTGSIIYHSCKIVLFSSLFCLEQCLM